MRDLRSYGFGTIDPRTNAGRVSVVVCVLTKRGRRSCRPRVCARGSFENGPTAYEWARAVERREAGNDENLAAGSVFYSADQDAPPDDVAIAIFVEGLGESLRSGAL